MAEYIGTVTKHPFAVGSKSEHDAVFLETGDERFVLRRVGGNPFYDPELDRLVGKTIRCNGRVAGYALLVSDWTECSTK
jgi:hypothetical protein